MKKFAGITLKLISDIKKYQFIEIRIRGGMSVICKSCDNNDNSEFLKLYNLRKPASHIKYLDT